MDEPNRYAPPRVNLNPPAHMLSPEQQTQASTGQRFVAYLVDTFCHFALIFFVGVINELAGLHLDADGLGGNLFSFVIIVSYFIVFELALGRTIGKYVAGTRVIRCDGGPPELPQLIGRTLVRFVPFEPFSSFSSDGMWHDKWSGTRVISTRGI